MQIRRFFFLSTLVCAFSTGHSQSFASTELEEVKPTPKNELHEVENVTPPDPEKTENIVLTAAPQMPTEVQSFVTKFSHSNYYYPFKQELALHGGVVFGLRDSADTSSLMYALFGFSYVLPKRESPKWETGVDWTAAGRGHLHLARRFIYNEKGAFRPFYSYGLINNLVPDEKLASFSNWNNYLARVTVGLEDIVRPPRSVIIELMAAAGTRDLLFMFTYGYSWGF